MSSESPRRSLLIALAVLPAGAAADDIVLRDYLLIEPVGRSRRSAVHTDAIEARIVNGDWSAPQAGDAVVSADGKERAWESVTAAENGALPENHAALRGGYAFTTYESRGEHVMVLHAVGHSTVYVNGVPRAGDPYKTGKVRLPVARRRGANEFLFKVSRGRLNAKLVEPAKGVSLGLHDATLPDLIVGETTDTWAAIMLTNAMAKPLTGLSVRAALNDVNVATTPVGPVAPLSVRKIGFRLRGSAPSADGKAEVAVDLLDVDGWSVIDSAVITLDIRAAGDKHKRTFVSEIDGSVQYYAVVPEKRQKIDKASPALFLTLHGAGVEASGQASKYKAKSWGHVVAPTNRRHYGFDWEDWGRIDALEVLAQATARYQPDPNRVYLTGHSMGGHATWQVGVTFPDRFAAIAPSAGWISFWSYAGAQRFEDEAPVDQMLRRATSSSDTLALSRNYLHHGVYILHGERDDNVPVDQARAMRKHRAEFHADFAYYERPGAGHWWGDACVDWPPLFDFLKSHVRPDRSAVRHVEFVTANPGVSASSNWVTIEAQIEHLKPAKVDIRFDPEKRSFVGTTENVARLALDLDLISLGEPIVVELDGHTVVDTKPPADARRIHLARAGDAWEIADAPPLALKGPHRYGPFKDAFRNRVMFVYSTRGTPEENAWSFAKARYDAETFWYRGNSSVDVIADADFDAAETRDRNVIPYGNADTNLAWQTLLADTPIQVRRGRIRIGDREQTGDEWACLFIRPKVSSDRALIGVVSGTGLPGMRLNDRLPYFVSGVAYPDFTLISTEMLTEGAAGVRAAGFFAQDWSLDSSQTAWRE